MTTLRQAAQQALEDICGAKLCEVNSMSSRMEMLRLIDKAIAALREALAEQPAHQWIGLTDDERKQAIYENTCTGLWFMTKEIEAKLKEKNT